MKLSDEQKRVNNATDLLSLAAILNDIEGGIRDNEEYARLENVVDLSSLPLFGGSDMSNSEGVWSWDATHVLLADGNFPDTWHVKPRAYITW